MRKNKLGHKATKRCWIADLALVSNIEHSVCSGGRTASEAEAKTPNTLGNIAFVQLGKFDRWLAGAATTTSTETLSPPPTSGIFSPSTSSQAGHITAFALRVPSCKMAMTRPKGRFSFHPRQWMLTTTAKTMNSNLGELLAICDLLARSWVATKPPGIHPSQRGFYGCR